MLSRAAQGASLLFSGGVLSAVVIFLMRLFCSSRRFLGWFPLCKSWKGPGELFFLFSFPSWIAWLYFCLLGSSSAQARQQNLVSVASSVQANVFLMGSDVWGWNTGTWSPWVCHMWLCHVVFCALQWNTPLLPHSPSAHGGVASGSLSFLLKLQSYFVVSLALDFSAALQRISAVMFVGEKSCF